MKDRLILLVEDNPDDEELTLRCFRDSKIANRVIVARQLGLDWLVLNQGTPPS